MGMDISVKGIVGAYLEDFVDAGHDEEHVYDLAADGDLDYSSPYYDSGSDAWFIGYEIDKEFDDPQKLYSAVHEKWEAFKGEFGFSPTFLITQHVT